MSRPSSDFPIVKTLTLGEDFASVWQYAYAFAEFTNSPGAPIIRPKYARGEGTLADAGK
jgi:hypothetical protein